MRNSIIKISELQTDFKCKIMIGLFNFLLIFLSFFDVHICIHAESKNITLVE